MNEDSEESEENDEDDEESEEEFKYEFHLSMKYKYFVMRTGTEGGFLRGQQVFNCYGRLNNTDMLLEYGFCLLPNRYDSVYVRVIFIQMLKAKNINGKIELPKLDLLENTKLKYFLRVYYLKYDKLNDTFLEYFRKLIPKKERYTLEGELKVSIQAKQVLNELLSSFPTSLEEDEGLILQAPNIPIRTYFALSKKYAGYRISQKRIIKSHLNMMSILISVFEAMQAGESMSNAHWQSRSINHARIMYPLRNYLKNIRTVSFD